jgi:hypothetical protein
MTYQSLVMFFYEKIFIYLFIIEFNAFALTLRKTMSFDLRHALKRKKAFKIFFIFQFLIHFKRNCLMIRDRER